MKKIDVMWLNIYLFIEISHSPLLDIYDDIVKYNNWMYNVDSDFILYKGPWNQISNVDFTSKF